MLHGARFWSDTIGWVWIIYLHIMFISYFIKPFMILSIISIYYLFCRLMYPAFKALMLFLKRQIVATVANNFDSGTIGFFVVSNLYIRLQIIQLVTNIVHIGYLRFAYLFAVLTARTYYLFLFCHFLYKNWWVFIIIILYGKIIIKLN